MTVQGQRHVADHPPSQSKVGQKWISLPVEQNVRWFQVAMHHMVFVDVVQRLGDSGNQPDGFTERQSLRLECFFQRLTRNEVADQIDSVAVAPHLMHGDDVRMPNLSGGSRPHAGTIRPRWP